MSIETPNQCMTAQDAITLLNEGASCQIESDLPAQFQVGDRVRAKVMHPRAYTRLPRYIRGKVGDIVKDHGVYVFPDTLGQRLSTKPQHVYSVRFSARSCGGWTLLRTIASILIYLMTI